MRLRLLAGLEQFKKKWECVQILLRLKHDKTYICDWLNFFFLEENSLLKEKGICMYFERSEFINHIQVKYYLEKRSFRKYKVIGTIEVVWVTSSKPHPTSWSPTPFPIYSSCCRAELPFQWSAWDRRLISSLLLTPLFCDQCPW